GDGLGGQHHRPVGGGQERQRDGALRVLAAERAPTEHQRHQRCDVDAAGEPENAPFPLARVEPARHVRCLGEACSQRVPHGTRDESEQQSDGECRNQQCPPQMRGDHLTEFRFDQIAHQRWPPHGCWPGCWYGACWYCCGAPHAACCCGTPAYCGLVSWKNNCSRSTCCSCMP